jgi:hypothetical protein
MDMADMNFEEFKKRFDASFNKLSSKEVVARLEKTGFEFEPLNVVEWVKDIKSAPVPSLVKIKPSNISSVSFGTEEEYDFAA